MTQTASIGTLSDTARALVAPGKGILAADESTGTIKRRFDSIGAESTETNRRDYREMLFRTPGVSEFISGVILYDETIRQKSYDGTPLVSVLSDAGMMPGIKVDMGAKELAGAPGESVTEGLDGLRERLAEYAELGARFTKWRAVITIGPGIPSAYCLDVNAHALARFAALTQEAGMVPMVEPEVLMDGGHSIDQCYDATEAALAEVFRQLRAQGVALDGILLKPNMVLSGASAEGRAGREEVAEKTVQCLEEHSARDGTGHRLPFGRPGRRGGYNEPGCDKPVCPACRRTVGVELLLRPGLAGRAPPNLGGQQRESRRSRARIPPPREGNVGGAAGTV